MPAATSRGSIHPERRGRSSKLAGYRYVTQDEKLNTAILDSTPAIGGNCFSNETTRRRFVRQREQRRDSKASDAETGWRLTAWNIKSRSSVPPAVSPAGGDPRAVDGCSGWPGIRDTSAVLAGPLPVPR